MKRPPVSIRIVLFFHWLLGWVPGGMFVRELLQALIPEIDELWDEYENAKGYDS